MISVLLSLPVIVVVILRINTIEQNTAFKTGDGYTKIRGSLTATKFGVTLYLFLQCTPQNRRPLESIVAICLIRRIQVSDCHLSSMTKPSSKSHLISNYYSKVK